MGDGITGYLLEQRASFREAPLSDVDSLVFSTIAYFNFEAGELGNTVPSELVPLPVAVCGIAHHNLYGDIWLERMGGDEFLSALLASPRFMDVKVGYYVNEVSNHFEKQFSAVSFFLPTDEVYVAYRGTDNTIAGWKEDFNLTHTRELPSHVSARSYLEDIADLGASRLFVGGHSKGGNLAEYAVLTCRENTFAKVARVFNHDGPGFVFPPSERIDSAEYVAKLDKTVPGSSVFGMLMETRDRIRIVQSSGVLFLQHASTHWAVEDGSFVELANLSPEAEIVTNVLNSWKDLYDNDKRELFIDAVFEVLWAADADTWSEFSQHPAETARAIAEATIKLPPDMRATIVSMIGDIAPILASEVTKRVHF
ncbi:MAG: DUF2974 domain-containing protein [Eggerthellaceae bacterium]|nr:DUF2974 domain-containing protein [Eggerthellaceae bacterium]